MRHSSYLELIDVEQCLETLIGPIFKLDLTLPIDVSQIKDLILLCTGHIRFDFKEQSYKKVMTLRWVSQLERTIEDILPGVIEKQIHSYVAQFTMHNFYDDEFSFYR